MKKNTKEKLLFWSNKNPEDLSDLIYFDFETTGLDPYHDKIIEYAFIQEEEDETYNTNYENAHHHWHIIFDEQSHRVLYPTLVFALALHNDRLNRLYRQTELHKCQSFRKYGDFSHDHVVILLFDYLAQVVVSEVGRQFDSSRQYCIIFSLQLCLHHTP